MTLGSNPQIIYRLVLAKSLFKSGLEQLHTNVDIFGFSQGLIAFHDALDNFTGAVATQLNISLPQESRLIASINLIQEHERITDSTFSLISRNEIVQLNTVRNNIKHQGITPNISQSKTLIGPVVNFLREYSKRYFNLEWDFISLADLIKKDSVKEALKEVEILIDQSKYKEALNKMAIVKFQVFDESLLRIRLDSRYDLFSQPTEETKRLRASNNIFPTKEGLFTDLYDRTDFIEKGIDRDLMSKFEDLTASVGVNDAKDWKYILKHGHWWGETNWTREIAIFCFDFLIDAIIKHQGRGNPVQQKWISEIYQIQAIDDLHIYDKNHNLVYTLIKGEEREASILSYVDGNWEIFDKSDRFITLYQDDEKERIRGFLNEGDETKINFVKTSLYTRDEKGNWVLLKETS